MGSVVYCLQMNTKLARHSISSRHYQTTFSYYNSLLYNRRVFKCIINCVLQRREVCTLCRIIGNDCHFCTHTYFAHYLYKSIRNKIKLKCSNWIYSIYVCVRVCVAPCVESMSCWEASQMHFTNARTRRGNKLNVSVSGMQRTKVAVIKWKRKRE